MTLEQLNAIAIDICGAHTLIMHIASDLFPPKGEWHTKCLNSLLRACKALETAARQSHLLPYDSEVENGMVRR